ncbi:MAG: hypothetical protein AABZ41_02665, partial [Bacteroidota bacterium]
LWTSKEMDNYSSELKLENVRSFYRVFFGRIKSVYPEFGFFGIPAFEYYEKKKKDVCRKPRLPLRWRAQRRAGTS